MKKQTAMQQLLNQMREERIKLPLPSEFDKAYRAIEMMIEHTYFQVEMEQIMLAHIEGFKKSAEGYNGEHGIDDFNNLRQEIGSEDYYNETYKINP